MARRRARKNPESQIGKTILESTARTVYVMGYADRVEDLGLDGPGGGGDWMDYAPAGFSVEAQRWAEEVWTEIVAKNPMALPSGASLTEGIEECWKEAVERANDAATKANHRRHIEKLPLIDVDDEEMQVEFGHYIAMQVLGTGSRWSDDHADHELKLPRRESDAWGIVPDADLAPLVNIDMLGEEIAENTVPQIEDEDYEEDHAVTLMNEVGVALTDYDNISNEASLQEYVSALSGLHSHLNYAASYENEALERARDYSSLLLAGARRALAELKGEPRENPIIEWKPSPNKYAPSAQVQDFVEPGPAKRAYELISQKLRNIKMDTKAKIGHGNGVFIEAGVGEGNTVDLAVYCAEFAVLDRDDAASASESLEERAEFAKAHADFVFRDQITHSEVEVDATSAVSSALYPLRHDLYPSWPIEVNGELMEVRRVFGGRKILISYEIYTPESIENGDAAERGWENEDGVSMEPDEYDIEEGVEKYGAAAELSNESLGAVYNAVKFLRDEGASDDGGGQHETYYGETIQNRDYFEQGIDERHTYHLANFDEGELKAIHAAMRSPRRNPIADAGDKCRGCGVTFAVEVQPGMRMRGAARDEKDLALCEGCGKKADLEHERLRAAEEREDARMLLADRAREQHNPTPTRAQIRSFREYLNKKHADTKHKNRRYEQKTRAYGDYLYAQDRAMFDVELESALGGDARFADWVKPNPAVQKYDAGAFGTPIPRWRGAKSRGHIGVQKDIDWDSQPLGDVSDRELARRLKVSKSVVTAARNARRIPPAARGERS